MRCQQAQELFSDYISEEIEPALIVTLESHLSGCDPCRTEVEGLRQLWNQLDEVELIDAPSDLHAQIMARVATAQEQPVSVVTPNRWRLSLRSLMQPRVMAFAAAALILMLAGVQVVQKQRAAMGPLDVIINLLYPKPAASSAPALQTLRGKWIPEVGGGGTLMLQLQMAPSATESRDTLVPYRIQVAGIPEAETQGALVGKTAATLNIPIVRNPVGDTLRVTILLTPAEGDAQSREIAIPLANPEMGIKNPNTGIKADTGIK